MKEPNSQESQPTPLDLALAYAHRGWHVLPIVPGEKSPLTSHGFKDATIEPEKLMEWWKLWPAANVAIRTGAASGLAVLDIDRRDGGDVSFAALLDDAPDLANELTLAVQTPGGAHIYFALPAGGARTGKLLPGVELRAEGAYVVAPPSRRPDGEYRGIVLGGDELRPLPGAILALRNGHGSASASTQAPSEWRERIATGAPDGERHDTCIRIAGSLLGRGVPRELVLEVMQGWARGCTPPFPATEVEYHVLDIADREAAQHAAPVEFGPIAHQLADVPAEPDWTWQGLLAPGALTLLAGQPKVGKSTLLFGLLGALDAGRPFLDRPTRATRALLLSEEREPTLAEKRATFLADANPHLLMRHRMGAASWPAVVEQARAHAREHGLGVLVVDTFLTWAGLRGGEENDAGAVLAAIEPLLAAAADGLAVLVVAHRRKAFGTHGEAVRGSNALTGAVDVILELERAPRRVGPRVRELRAESRFAGTDRGFACELTEHGYVARGPLGRLRAVAAEAELLELVGRMPGATTAELADAAEVDRQTMLRKLRGAAEDGLVRREGEGQGARLRWHPAELRHFDNP